MPTPRRPISRAELSAAFLFARPARSFDQEEGLAQVLSALHSIVERHPEDDALADQLLILKDEYEIAVALAMDSEKLLDTAVGMAAGAFFATEASRTTSGVLAGIVGRGGDCSAH